MADLKRSQPEPPPGPPQIQWKSGLADELLNELSPLLAEDGIDIHDLEATDLDTLQAAMNRAVERRNMALFTPVGPARDVAAATLGLVVDAILDDNTTVAAAILDQVQPESPDNSVATVASCIGISLGLLDNWMTAQDPAAPNALSARTRLPSGHWTGERAATDVLVLAGKGRAFKSLQTLITRQGSHQLLPGSALALAAATQAWADTTGTPRGELIRQIIR
jgi:hypothetical protein